MGHRFESCIPYHFNQQSFYIDTPLQRGGSRIKRVERDWSEVQKDHDGGMFLVEIMDKYKISRIALNTAEKHGLFRKVKNKRFCSAKSRKKISEKRIKYLKENPDKHPWRQNAKFRSMPCDKLKGILEETSYLSVGRKYGVSNNAIRKWVRA